MKTRTTCAIMLALSLSATPVVGQSFYVGGGIGSSFFSSEIGEAVDRLTKISENATAWKLFGGFSPARFIGIEGGYRHFGTVSANIGSVGFESSTKGWDVEALGRLQIAIIDLFGKAGLMFWNTDSTLGSTTVGDSSGTDFFWGLGGGLRLGPVGVRVEWESVEASTPDNLSMVSVSGTLGF
jgi:hypothetical protein